MRIAVFVGSFPVVSETFILRQITGLIDLGHEVDIFAAQKPWSDEPVHAEVLKYDLMRRTMYFEEPRDACYWEMPVRPLTGETWIPGEEKSLWNMTRVVRAVPAFFRCICKAPRLTFQVLNPKEYGYQAHSLSTLYRLAKLCGRKKRYDVLHAHFGPMGNTFRFARALQRAPYVVSFHGYDFSTFPRAHGRNVYSQLFETADLVTVNSQYMAQGLQQLGCPAAKLRAVPYGLAIDTFRFEQRAIRKDGTVRVLTVARLVEKKGIEYSLRAIAKVRERRPNLRYDIIGEGPLRPRLEELIGRLGLCGSVTLHGAQDINFVRQMMATAHLFVLASVTAPDGDQEGTPVSLIEAQACGMPVLSSRHSGIPETVLHGQSGFLLPERDVAGLAERLTFLVEHSEVWPEMGRKGRDHVEALYDIRRLNRELVGQYEEAIKDYRRKTHAWTRGDYSRRRDDVATGNKAQRPG
jgi:colanic acid/amylovoran biosynthesis glycosyltransferase